MTATLPAAALPTEPTEENKSRPTRWPGRRRRPSSIYILILILAAFFVGPFIWLVLAALKTPEEWTAIPTQLLPSEPQWNNFVAAVTEMDFAAYTMNSLFLSTIYSVLITLSSAAVGFGFARLRAPGKRALFVVLISTMMLPNILTQLPTYVMFSRIGLINTYWPWVLWGLAASPFMVFLFRQFYSTLPLELEDAAIVDGAGWGRIFFSIFLPLSRSILLTSFLLSFTWAWSDYIAPAIFLDLDRTTLAVAITAWYQDPAGNVIPTVQAAAAVLYIVPVLLIFFVFQRYFIRSSVGSGVKG